MMEKSVSLAVSDYLTSIPLFQYSKKERSAVSDFFKWLIVGWSIVVVGIAALGAILIIKYGEVKKIETDDVSLCFIIAFFCWLIPIIAFSILARTLGF